MSTASGEILSMVQDEGQLEERADTLVEAETNPPVESA